MSKIYLLMSFCGRGVNWGVRSGSILGVLWYLAIYQFYLSIYLLYGAILGLISGIILGGLIGLLLGAITISFYHPPKNEANYRRVMLLVTVTSTFIGSVFIIYSSLSFYAVQQETIRFVILSLIVAVTAAIASGQAIQNVSSWYLEQQKTQKA